MPNAPSFRFRTPLRTLIDGFLRVLDQQDYDPARQILEKVSAVLTAESAREIKQILRGFADKVTASSSSKLDVTGQSGTLYFR